MVFHGYLMGISRVFHEYFMGVLDYGGPQKLNRGTKNAKFFIPPITIPDKLEFTDHWQVCH